MSGKKREVQREDGWIRGQKTWRWLELGRETKLTESYEEDFRAVATSNREMPEEKDSEPVLIEKRITVSISLKLRI